MDKQYNETFKTLTEVEQRVVLEYLKGTRFEKLATEMNYSRDYLYRVLKKSVGKLIEK